MRSFVAVRITDHGITEMIKKVQSEIGANHKCVTPENLHFTLLFLGEVSQEMLADMTRVIKGIRFSPFDLSLTGVGAFPSTWRARTVWAGTDSPGGDKISKLANSVRAAFESLGPTDDKPFKPHMTIFRVKKKAENMTDELKPYENLHLGTQKVDKIILMKSVLSPDRPPAYSNITVVGAAT